MTIWQNVITELSWSMPPAGNQHLAGSTLTVANGIATVTVANEAADNWVQVDAHMSFVIKRRLIANRIQCERVTIEY